MHCQELHCSIYLLSPDPAFTLLEDIHIRLMNIRFANFILALIEVYYFSFITNYFYTLLGINYKTDRNT